MAETNLLQNFKKSNVIGYGLRAQGSIRNQIIPWGPNGRRINLTIHL